MDKDIIGIGRRKRAVASVRLRPGKGNLDINGKKFEEYFPLDYQREKILDPIHRFGNAQEFDIIIRVKGGGLESQVNASRLGISRALVKKDETLRKQLKELGYLTRDPRKKERKKYGLAGARKRYQHSKR